MHFALTQLIFNPFHIMLMIQNNLDNLVAQHPEELITYGGNGSVFQNWAQYRLVMQYLSQMNDEQTLVMNSGHPLGLFPSSKDAPRVAKLLQRLSNAFEKQVAKDNENT